MLLQKQIKNIIFDLGGVLLNLDFGLTNKAFEHLGIKDFKQYFNKGQQVHLFNQFETGKITEHEFCEGLRQLTQLNLSNDDIVAAWNSMLLDFPVIRKEILIALKKKYRLFLLSNTNETHVSAFNKIVQRDIGLTTLDPLFEKSYFSNEIGYRKPNKDAFNYVLQQHELLPEETLFIDDSIQHVKGAKMCGIHAYHLKVVEEGETTEQLFADILT